MALPPYDFLTSAPTDQLGTSLGTDFDYLNAFRSGQGIRNDIDYSDQPMITVMPPPFTIGDNPDVISDMSLIEYKNFQKYMNERGAADLINTQNKVAPIDGGIKDIILPPITSGNQDNDSGIPTLRKSYTTGATAETTGTGIDSKTFLKGPEFYKNNAMTEKEYADRISKIREYNKNLDATYTDAELRKIIDLQTQPQGLEPKQNFLQKGIGSIKDFFGKFNSGPKVKGTLGTRLSKRINNPGFQLPFQGALSSIFKKRSPFNPEAKNYNPILEEQLNIAEAGDKVGYDEKSGLLKYSKNSVLSGQNAISGFGTNDYEKQLESFLEKSQGVFDKKYGDVDIEELMAKKYTVSELKKLSPTNKFDAQKIKAATYKTKYINATLEELKPFKSKRYIAAKELQEKMTNIGNVKPGQQTQANKDYQRVQRAYREDTEGKAGSYAPGGGSGQQFDNKGNEVGYNDPFDPGGGEKDGGHIDGTNRRRFGEGGIVTL